MCVSSIDVCLYVCDFVWKRNTHTQVAKKDPLAVYAKGSSGEASVVIGIGMILICSVPLSSLVFISFLLISCRDMFCFYWFADFVPCERQRDAAGQLVR